MNDRSVLIVFWKIIEIKFLIFYRRVNADLLIHGNCFSICINRSVLTCSGVDRPFLIIYHTCLVTDQLRIKTKPLRLKSFSQFGPSGSVTIDPFFCHIQKDSSKSLVCDGIIGNPLDVFRLEHDTIPVFIRMIINRRILRGRTVLIAFPDLFHFFTAIVSGSVG